MRSIDERLRDLLARASPKKKPKTVRRRKVKGDCEVDPTRLKELCETELVTIAHMVGYRHASRQMLPEDLIALILGQYDEPEDPLEVQRELLNAHVRGNARIMASQMPCDLRCPTCPHHQLVECFFDNQNLVE